MSLESFFAYIDREFFTPNIGELEYLKISENGFKWTVLALYFAFLLAAILIFYNRVIIGSFPRALIAANCITPEGAKTFTELGYKKNPFVAFTLRFGNTLRRSVRCVEGESWEKEGNGIRRSRLADFFLPEKRYKINFENDHFYVPEKYRDICAMRFEKKGNGVLSLILTAVGGLIAVILIMRFAPLVLDLVDGIVGDITQGSKPDILN